MLTIIDLERMFQVISGKFNIVGACSNGIVKFLPELVASSIQKLQSTRFSSLFISECTSSLHVS